MADFIKVTLAISVPRNTDTQRSQTMDQKAYLSRLGMELAAL